METALKQRLLGAAVLVALAVTFLPLLVMERAPDSGASDVPLKVPAAPDAGDTRTIDLPLAAPATGRPVLGTPIGEVEQPAAPDAQAPVVPAGAATAGGDYAVNFGSYASTSDAARVIAALAAARLPAYQESTALGARTVHRVRIGPYATAADAEAARLAASRVRSDVNARVVVLDADIAAPRAPAPAPPAAPALAAAKPAAAAVPATAPADPPKASAASATTPAAPASPPPAAAPSTAAAGVGFAVQLGAFANAQEATRLRDRARAAGFSAFVEQVPTDRGTLSRVRVGPVADRSAADALRTQVAGKLGVTGIVRQHP